MVCCGLFSIVWFTTDVFCFRSSSLRACLGDEPVVSLKMFMVVSVMFVRLSSYYPFCDEPLVSL
ncbi:hypothetical protein Hdeb2414_s0024g00650091 [Helianthus debilis subsp. tardiflorus]